MSDGEQAFGQVAAELLALLKPFEGVADDPQELYRLLGRFGWNLAGLVGADLAAVNGTVASVRQALEAIHNAGQLDDLEDIAATLEALGDAIAKLEDLRMDILTAASVNAASSVGEALGSDLLEFLALEYLARRSHKLYQTLIVLTIIRFEPIEILYSGGGTSGTIVRYPIVRPTLRLDSIGKVLNDPIHHFNDTYLPAGGVTNDRKAQEVVTGLFQALETLAFELGGEALAGLRSVLPAELANPANAPLLRSLTFALPLSADSLPASAMSRVGATMTIVPADGSASTGDAGPGVEVVPFGLVSLTDEFSSWSLSLVVDGAPQPFFLSPGNVGFLDPANGYLRVSAGVERAASRDSTLVIGGSSSTRLEVGRLALGAALNLLNSQSTYSLLLEAGKAAVVVGHGEGDGFLKSILPTNGLRTEFDLAIGWSNHNGVYFRGSAGLEAALRVDLDLFGLLKVNTVHLALNADEAGIRSEVSTTVTVHIGPVTAAVERFGLEALLTFPADGGNLGVADVDLHFKPPSGAALTVDAGVVVGGGYLSFDQQKEQYAGAVHLELAETLNLTAFGLLTTRMPDGSPGFSLLVLIAATFAPPVQLGYGFTLSGVGGLIGVNRTAAVETLRAGLRTGSLGSVLFPVDPIRNAPQIVSDLAAIFPPAPGRFLVGPMIQLGWGSPTLLTIELGLILELPAPVRLLILGRLKIALPDQQAPIVKLQLDAVGLIDFSSGDVALDAVLYDSRIAAFTVTGGMALRASFGHKPNMVLAIGGFNPRFQPPAGFPTLDRVAINLATGDNPRLRLEAYFALTTNTVQFGALLDLFAKAGPFSIAGMMGLDVLMQLAPFGFIADIGANLALKYENKSVMSVGLRMTLTGPTPWHAWGKATYEVLFFSGTIDFDVTIGPAQKPALPPPVDIRSLIQIALREPGNWSTELPRGEHPIVSLRDQLGIREHLVHPLADLRVTQRVAPLGREITRFGAARPERERIFDLGIVGADGKVRSTAEEGVQAVSEHFAPAQFRQMTDDEKLTAPAFEPMQAGIRFASPGYVCGPAVVEKDILFAVETIHRADQVPTTRSLGAERSIPISREDVRIETDFVARVANVGAAALAPIARTGDRRFESPAPAAVALREPLFAVVMGRGFNAVVQHLSDTGPSIDGKPAYTEAVEALQSSLEARPADRGRLHVVQVYEGALE